MAIGVDEHADLRPLHHLPRGAGGGRRGIPAGVVHTGDAQAAGAEEHSWAAGGEEAGGAGGDGRYPGPEPERQAGIRAESGLEPEPTPGKLGPPCVKGFELIWGP